MVPKKKPAPRALPIFVPKPSPSSATWPATTTANGFTPRKALFEAELKEPMLAIVRKVTDAMMDFAPAFVRPAEKSLFRIYRDTRFSANKLPYKTHVAAWWSHQGLEKTSGAGYYFHVSAKEVIVAAGAYMPEKDQLAQSAIGCSITMTSSEASPEACRAQTFHEFEGNALTRPPKGFPCEHPGMDLIRCRQWGLAATLPAEEALKPNFAATLIRYFKIATPVVDALNTPIAAAQAPRKKSALRTALSAFRSIARAGASSPRVKVQFAGSNRPKTKKNRPKIGKTRTKYQETCGNRAFTIDFATLKPHCNHRQGSSKPHEYRGFAHSQPRSHLLHAVRISRRKPVNTGSPEGSPRRRTS